MMLDHLPHSRVRRLMDETGMGFLQARNHLRQRDELRRRPSQQNRRIA